MKQSFTIICNTCENKVVVTEGKDKNDQFIYDYEDDDNPVGVFNEPETTSKTFFGCKKCGTVIGA